jgi:hypothetical protein
MPRFVQPITWNLANTDEASPGPLRIAMLPWVFTWVVNRHGLPKRMKALVDTGSSFTTVGWQFAENVLRLDVPPPNTRLQLITATGTIDVPATQGEIRLWFDRLPERTLELLCIFRDQPDGVPPLLGLHNLIDLVTVRFDGTPLPHAGPSHPEDGMMGSMEFVFPDRLG